MNERASHDDFNADELVAPECLNEQFVTEVLSNYEKAPELKVNMLTFSPASAKGDHYASVMFRAKVEYSTQKGASTKSLIIKTMPEQEGHKKEMFPESYLFKTEIGMYGTVLPEFERILRQAGDDTNLHGECIFHSLEPRQNNEETGAFEDCMLLDYQVSNLCPITIDLIYSIYLLMGPEQLWNHLDDLIGFYFSVLIETLKIINFKGEFPTLKDLWQQMYRHKYYDFFSISTSLPFIWALKIKAFEIEDLIKQKELRAKCYSIGGFIEDVTRILERFDR